MTWSVHALVQAIILGVLTGGVYALMASGQTLIFGIMKVVNLAQAAFVVLAAYLTFSLFTLTGMDPFLSILITTPILFALGVAIQWTLLRVLRPDEAAQLSLLVTFAVALGLEGLLAIVYNTTYRSIQPGYENFSWTVLGYQVNMVRFFAFLLSLAMLGVLYLILHRTKFGRAVRATVQNPMSAQLLGVNSEMVAALGFGLGAATAAAGGAVFGLITPFNPGSHYDLISRLLTIVVLGGLGSIGGSIIAALVMGIGLGGRRRAGLPHLVGFHLLHGAAPRAAAPPQRAPRCARAGRDMNLAGLLRAGIFFGALALLPLAVEPPWILNLLIFTLMYAGLASAWNLLGGYAGYPSLGHAAFFGLGAYAIAIMFENSVGDGYLPFFLLPAIGLGAALVSVPIGWIAMRTRADVFAIVTITLLFIAQTLAFNLRSITGGAQGKSVAVPPFPVETYGWPFYYAMLVLLALAMGVSFYFRRSKIGLSLSAVRADEDKAHGVGVRVTGVKLIAFAASVGITAMVGGVWAYYVGFIYPQFAVDPLLTIGMVLMTFLGGRATLWGPVVGAFILVPAQQYLAYDFGASQIYLLAYAAIFLIIMLLMPRGILPTVTDRLRNQRRRRQTIDGLQEAGR